jgi:N-acetylmuramoyl-L-alanine amidase
MPNVLVEVGFVTNKDEAKNLSKSQYKREIAKGIFESILDFKNKYERK